MRCSHRVIPRLLATGCLWQAERLQRVRRKASRDREMCVDLIVRQRIARQLVENAIDWTVVITELGKPRLDSLDRRIRLRDTIINGRGIVVRLNAAVIVRLNAGVIVRLRVSVVIVGVVVVGVIRQVIPRVKSVIQSEPETVEKDKEATVVKVGMPPVPIAVPICLMTFSDVVRP